jgi:hypothetical protein
MVLQHLYGLRIRRKLPHLLLTEARILSTIQPQKVKIEQKKKRKGKGRKEIEKEGKNRSLKVFSGVFTVPLGTPCMCILYSATAD